MMAFRSLRAQLLFWLLAPLALVSLLDAWITYTGAQETASIVQERMLLGAARMIGEQVHLEEGVVQVVIPPAALELFASPSRDRVFYRISSNEGQLLSGYYDLALPPRPLAAEEVLYFDGRQRDRDIHAVAFAQPVFAAPARGPILIQVAQTLEGRNELAREIWGSAVRRQLAMLTLVSVLLWFGLRRGMLPLLALRNRMLQRKSGELEQLDTEAVPTEIQPLVAALNDYVQRLDRHMSAHSRFIADASHQLRTPLTLLNTQVVYALRQADPAIRQEALTAIHASVRHSIRLVNQLLSFNVAEASLGLPARMQAVVLGDVVRRAVESLALVAQQRSIDLGLEDQGLKAQVFASAPLLQELVANLVDNALRYTQRGGVVTASVSAADSEVVLQVQDNGPGIPEAFRSQVFERFFRLNNADSDGCGLGLAIVREIAEGCDARVELGTPAAGGGLLVTVRFKRHLAAPVVISALDVPQTYRAAATNSVV
jgi:two-component system sensor histidine kinase TctE